MVLAADYGVGPASPSLDIWSLPEVIRKSYERIMEQMDSGCDPAW